MNILRSWREIKIMLKRKFPILSDEDFAFNESNRDRMLDQLASKLNKTRSELELILVEFQKQ